QTFLSDLWQRKKERLAIGDGSYGNNAPCSRGLLVHGLTSSACKTLEYPHRTNAFEKVPLDDSDVLFVVLRRRNYCYISSNTLTMHISSPAMLRPLEVAWSMV
ncbi:unnamed protein product, partial [Ectocarpus sp. 12 AP-2014]